MSKKPRVYVTRMIPKPGIDLLKQECDVKVNPDDRVLTRKELIENIREADGVLCLLTDKIDTQVFDTAISAKGFANYAVGYDNIDIKEATGRGIPVSNTPGVLTDATAELAWAILFTVARRVVESDSFMRSGKWHGWGPLQFIGGDIEGKTLGVVGTGRIGTAMALKSRGFNMKVVYSDVVDNPVLEEKCGAKRVSFEELLSSADFISIHVPLMDSTHHLFNRETFRKMKQSAYLVNTSRGPVINEKDLLEALRNGRIAGAAIDVYEKEPLLTPGLEKLDNIVVTPHIASATHESRTNMALKAARNLLAMLRGEHAPDCVNPEVYEN